MFSMSSSEKPVIRFIAGEGRVIQPKAYRQNQLIFPLQWINEYESNNRLQQIHETPKVNRMQDGRVSVSFPTETRPLYPCERCQIEGRRPSACTHAPKRSTSSRYMGPVSMINTPDVNNEFMRSNQGNIYAARWVVQKTTPEEFGSIEKVVNWSNINAVEQNQALGEILLNQQQILSEIDNLRKQVRKVRWSKRMSTQQLSNLHETPRPITMITFIGAVCVEEMEKTRQCFAKKKVSRHWKSKPTKPWHIWEVNASENCQKAFWRSYARPLQYPWPIKPVRWGDNDNYDSDKTSMSSNTNTMSDEEPLISIMMERQNPNPFYVDTRRRFTVPPTMEAGQTSDPNRPTPTPTQNPSGATQFTAPEFTQEPAPSGVESTNPAGRPPTDAPTTEQGDEISQGEEWETRVQIGHSTTGKMLWNIGGIKPKERLAYF